MNINKFITEQCGFNPADATNMTEAEIRAYFTEANFIAMFGEAVVTPYTLDQLADAAVELVAKSN
jgi:hypothetical protein